MQAVLLARKKFLVQGHYTLKDAQLLVIYWVDI